MPLIPICGSRSNPAVCSVLDQCKYAPTGVLQKPRNSRLSTIRVGDKWDFGTSWQHRERFARNSPATFIPHAHTHTLMLDGEDNQSNPLGHSKNLYRALKHFGVETEMDLSPGDVHLPKNGAYNIGMFTRIPAWHDRHLKKVMQFAAR